MNVATWQWLLTIGIATAVLLFDVIMIARNPHRPSTKELSVALSFYIGAAIAFGIWVWLSHGSQLAGEFYAGWLTEYSLSVDNLFVFLVIISRFAVRKEMQQRVLMVGILIAILLRGVFILAGVRIIESFTWVFYVFGAYLIYVAIRQALGGEGDSGSEEGRIVRALRTRVGLSPFVLVVVSLGGIDVLFALDSIPAIFSVTTDPFLVWACTIFALMGLRQLYFLLGDLLDRLEYLDIGIAVILGFIGLKLVLQAMATNDVPWINGGRPIGWVPTIETWQSLLVIVASMTIAVGASLLRQRRD